jgi:hypothetical protein
MNSFMWPFLTLISALAFWKLVWERMSNYGKEIVRGTAETIMTILVISFVLFCFANFLMSFTDPVEYHQEIRTNVMDSHRVPS